MQLFILLLIICSWARGDFYRGSVSFLPTVMALFIHCNDPAAKYLKGFFRWCLPCPRKIIRSCGNYLHSFSFFLSFFKPLMYSKEFKLWVLAKDLFKQLKASGLHCKFFKDTLAWAKTRCVDKRQKAFYWRILNRHEENHDGPALLILLHTFRNKSLAILNRLYIFRCCPFWQMEQFK